MPARFVCQMEVHLDSDFIGSGRPLQLRTVVVATVAVVVIALVVFHKVANQKAAKLARVGIVSTKKIFVREEEEEDKYDDIATRQSMKDKKAEKLRKEQEDAEVGSKYHLDPKQVKE